MSGNGITVSTRDELAGVRLVVSGHAREEFGEYERTAVCAAVSILVATLLQVTSGNLGAGAPGHLDRLLEEDHLEAGSFVVTGLGTLADCYPDHITIDQQDTRLRRRTS